MSIPLQQYLFPFDVFNGLKVRVEVNALSVDVLLILMPSCVSEISNPSTVQTQIGTFFKPSILLDTVQFNMYISPAISLPDISTVVLIASEGTERLKMCTW